MASLLAASRKNFPAACGLHARTKPVRLGAASLARLICALWQNNPPSIVQIRCAYRGYRTVAVRLRRNTHGPRLRPTPNHQVYLPFARRVKNGPESPAALARRCLRHECGLFSMPSRSIRQCADSQRVSRRVLTFAIGGTARLVVPRFGQQGPPSPTIHMNASPATVRASGILFEKYCLYCHAADAVIPDLRYVTAETQHQFEAMVLGGTRESRGPPSFHDERSRLTSCLAAARPASK
jgi:hypothetical protein